MTPGIPSAFPKFVKRLPTARDVVELTPDQLDSILLKCVAEITESNDQLAAKFVSADVLSSLYAVMENGYADVNAANQLIMESWGRLISSNLIVQAPGQAPRAMIATKRGCEVARDGRIEDIVARQLLRPEMLHPDLPRSVYTNFSAGDYETAVRDAFVNVEATIQAMAGLPANVFGERLIKQAFMPNSGPLADKTLPEKEQEQVLAFFIAALGTFKNPLSHRFVKKADPHAVMEELLIASRLMRFIK
jgi:uncharacterized protein (TIGR02391 family)